LLFWKAAAAGWRSYSIGGAVPLKQQPDWPKQETEFVIRGFSDPVISRIAPREPDLSRGAVARGFFPTKRRSLGSCVLVVSPYLPFPLSHGGVVRIWNVSRALAARWLA
jgi:hypothetical protein